MINTISLAYTNERPDKMQFFVLFETTGWNENYRVDADQLYGVLASSWFMVSVYDDGKLVGFGRIISDGILHALIVDVIVLPEYQRRGIGKEIMARLMKKCHQHQIRDIQLFCAKGKVDFYRNLGFEPRSENAPGMQYIHGRNDQSER